MPHWVAAREGRLDMPFCTACGRVAWPPGSVCHYCGGELEWRTCSGRGTILTFSVVRRAVQPEWKGAEPYVVAFIELEEGARLLSNVVDADPVALQCGDPVMAEFVETTDPALGLPVFRLAAAD